MGWYVICVETVRAEQHSPTMRGTGGDFRSYGTQVGGLSLMFIILAYFELLTLTDGSYRHRCCVRRITVTHNLAFGGCRPLQVRAGTISHCFHRQDQHRQRWNGENRRPAKTLRFGENEWETKKPRSSKTLRFSQSFLESHFVKRTGLS